MDNATEGNVVKVVLATIGSVIIILGAAFSAHTYMETKIDGVRKENMAMILPIRDDVTTLKVQRLSDIDRSRELQNQLDEIKLIVESLRTTQHQLEQMVITLRQRE